MSDYVPPHSNEAECAVLGAALLSPKAAATLADLLDPRDFYRGARGVLFDAIRTLVADGTTPDTTTVTELLARRDRLDEVGGPAALHDLTVACPSPSQVETYARIVADKSARRRARDADHVDIRMVHESRAHVGPARHDVEQSLGHAGFDGE
ncbi:MAG: DnaB-like helicase N-terminal domain-containing protein, partial [Phycisphaeraceae bacterium]